MKVDSEYQIKLQENETLTVGVFNPNGYNFAIGTSLGTLIFGSIKTEANGKSKVTIGKVENFSK